MTNWNAEHMLANAEREIARLTKLLRHIRHQANERLDDGHSYEMMLATTIIEIDGALPDIQEGG